MSTPMMPKQLEVPDLKPAGTSGTRLLEIERSKAAFDVRALSIYLYGQEYLDRMKRLLQIIEPEEAFNKSKAPYLGRRDQFRLGLRKDKRMAQLSQEHNWSKEDGEMAEWLIDLPGPYGLHKSMFLETLRSQSDEEQLKLFYEPASKFEIIGAYCQTELGHGSNVQRLETTATYLPDSQEWELHSPSQTASKWWIGGLGRTADHAVVMAQLITQGKNYGPHPFVVPLRDKKTRESLPGRTIGDIGPKFGYNTTDNGFLLLDHVRIPHINFLAKFSKVDKESGEFTRPPHAKLSYGTMTYIRANIVRGAGTVLARAATVAVRYCAIRRQFEDRDAPQIEEQKPVENQVLNYQLVQYRLFPVIVQSLAFHFTGQHMRRLYEDNQEAMKQGDFSLLADTHASSSALKSYVTIVAANAIETCRRACGGHGYSSAAGLGQCFSNFLPQVTWEGDSYMLTQQSGKYLMKTFRQLWKDRDTKPEGNNITADYILHYIHNQDSKAKINYTGDFKDYNMFIEAFGFRAAYLIGTLVRKRDIERRTWNSLLVDIFRASTAHAQYILVFNFAQIILHDKALRAQPALHAILAMCFELFACYTMDECAAEFLACSYLSPKQAELLRSHVDALLAAMRPQAVPLVDGFALPDYYLNSQIGAADGNVYPKLFDYAAREPINGIKYNTDPWDTELEIGESERLAKL